MGTQKVIAEQIVDGGGDYVLALKANPNVLETLWTPLVLHTSPLADELRAMRGAFLSQHLFKTYSGYVLSQFRRMAAAVRVGNEYKPKHAMHLVRLLHSGIHALKAGEILVDVSGRHTSYDIGRRANDALVDGRDASLGTGDGRLSTALRRLGGGRRRRLA